jgi:hypothetical protein
MPMIGICRKFHSYFSLAPLVTAVNPKTRGILYCHVNLKYTNNYLNKKCTFLEDQLPHKSQESTLSGARVTHPKISHVRHVCIINGWKV